MKKLMVLVLGMLFCVFVFATTYTLKSIGNSRVDLNGTDYNCSSISQVLTLPSDIGVVSSMILGTNCTIYESGGVAVVTAPLMKTTDINGGSLFYSFDKSTWEKISLIRADHSSANEKTQFTGYSRYNQSIDLSGFANGDPGTLYVYFEATGNSTPKTDPTADPTVNPYEATFIRTADVSFTDGSSFTPGQLMKGNETEIIGRFWMDSDVSGATFTDVSIDLDGTRTGFSNFELWSSTDDTFDGGDVQMGSTIVTDPGASPAVFSSLSKSISTSGDYYFLTADVDEDATGSIMAFIDETADLTVTSGIIGDNISNASLTSSEVPTSICLTSFVANLNMGKVELVWTTASETENSHFLVYRDGEVIAEIVGHGTCTEPHNYTYKDALVQAGHVYEYKISDVNLAGIKTEHASVMIEIEEDVMLSDFVMNKAYPNPFNPSTVIRLQYAVGSNAVVNIYNTQGVLVDQLINGHIDAGDYELTWNASGMPSGVYVVTMHAGDVMQSQKVVLMK